MVDWVLLDYMGAGWALVKNGELEFVHVFNLSFS